MTMASTNRRYASGRMTERNPMHRPETRAKVQAALKAMGHRPVVRGGNGQGPSEPQRLLAALLGWPMEVVVRTGAKRGDGWPFHYKLDIANPAAMVAVEVDGGSHQSIDRQSQDRRKEAFLVGRGWTVLRFSNRAVMADTAGCARTVLSTTSKLLGPTPTP